MAVINLESFQHFADNQDRSCGHSRGHRSCSIEQATSLIIAAQLFVMLSVSLHVVPRIRTRQVSVSCPVQRLSGSRQSKLAPRRPRATSLAYTLGYKTILMWNAPSPGDPLPLTDGYQMRRITSVRRSGTDIHHHHHHSLSVYSLLDFVYVFPVISAPGSCHPIAHDSFQVIGPCGRSRLASFVGSWSLFFFFLFHPRDYYKLSFCVTFSNNDNWQFMELLTSTCPVAYAL